MNDPRPLERRQLTVMLCDLVGSTALSMRLDAEELTDVLQSYRQRCGTIIRRHGGIVAQYVGDGIYAYFGYPRAHEDDAERALRAALDIVASAGKVPSENPAAEVHIGIATGVVVVGDISGSAGASSDSGVKPDVSAVGSALNLAARLQGLADPGAVVVSEQTRRLTGGMFEYVDLGRHRLKGFEAPVQAWQVIAESNVRGRFHALRATALTPLVDRKSELAQLTAIWDGVAGGRGRAVLLSSDPGVGKSRLTEEIAARIAERDCLRLWYYCSPHLQSTPLAPVIRQVAFAAGIAEADDADRKLRKLRALLRPLGKDGGQNVPLLASLLSVPYESRYPPLAMSVQRQKHRLFQVLMQLLERHAWRRPVLVVVEDLHWIDPSTDELIGVLIDRLVDLPILALLTARPEFQSHWDDKTQLLHMPLAPLERHDSIAMIESLCADRDIPAPTVLEIADKTDGLPLFIEDLTRDMLEVTEMQPGSGAPAGEVRPVLAIPATLTDSLMARLDRLGSAKRVAQVASVIGREFSYELLAKVADLPGEDLKDELYRLVESGLMLRSRSTDVLVHAFKHALVRDTAYSSLLKKEQAALHARVAKVLADDFPETANEQPERLANHLEAAGANDHAVHFLMKAAQLAAKRSGFVEALTHLTRGLRLLDAQPASAAVTRRKLQVYIALGDVNAEYRGFSAPECGDAYSKALDLCRELPDAPETFSVLSRLGSFHITRAEFRQCRERGEECLARAAGGTSKLPLVMGHRMLGGTSFLEGEFVPARQHLEQALVFYGEDVAPEPGAHAADVQDQKSSVLGYLGLTLSILGHPREGLDAAEDGLRHSRALGDSHTVNFSLCFLAAVHYIQRDVERALQCATQSLEMALEQRFGSWVGISRLIRGASMAQTGSCAEGLAEIGAGISAHSGMAAGAYQPFGVALLVDGLIVANRLDEASAALARAFEISEKTGERFYLAELIRLNGTVLAKRGERIEAERKLRESIVLAQRQGAKLFELRAASDLGLLLDA